MTTKIYIGLFILVISIIVGGVGYLYITHLNNKISILTDNNTKLKISNESLSKSLKQKDLDIDTSNTRINKLNTELTETRKSKGRLIKIFADHDLQNLIEKKPSLMSKKFQEGTRKVFKELEEASR